MKMPTFRKGEWPKASDLEKMARQIERLSNLTVAEGSGLTLSESAAGTVLGLAHRPPCRYAVSNSAIPKSSGTTLGKGTGILHRVTYTPAGAATLEAVDTNNVDIYNASNFDIPSGRRLMVELINGKFHVIADFCPAS